MRSGADPRATVIVIGYAPPELLALCLAALREQREAGLDVEILVVGHSSHQNMSFNEVKERFPEFTWIEAPASHNVARMRGLGIARSAAPVVALLEGDCTPTPGWLETLVTLHPLAATGGAIEPGNFSRSVDWAAYFCEFGRYMLPLPARSAQLPGANVVYNRSCLPDARELEVDGFYETFVNSRIGESHPLSADLVVRHERTWSGSAIMTTRFNHGRGFAALRTRGLSLPRRLSFMVLCLALPFVLVARVVAEPMRRRRMTGRAILTLPWILALSLSWAAGEFAGYAAGPGSSLDSWR